jgi:ankyrin repeat protein
MFSEAKLFESVRNGELQSVQAAIRNGCNVAETDMHGRTPLHVAASLGHADIAALLLEQGAAVDAKDRQSQTPLHHAAAGGHAALAELLVEHGADIGAQDSVQEIPHHYVDRNLDGRLAALLRPDQSTAGHAFRVVKSLKTKNGGSTRA